MAHRHIYLVRHGQTNHSQGHHKFGGGLTALGLEQAEFAAQRLAHLPVDVIHASSLRRAAQTAGIIALRFPAVPVKHSRLLWECIPYLPQKFVKWYKEHAERLEQGRVHVPPQYIQWLEIFPHATPFEKVEAGFVQAERAYARYFRPVRGRAERHEVVVCHGNIIRYFVARTLEAPPETWTHTDVNNCGISEVIVAPNGRATLISHNDTGHLPDSKRTFL